MEKEDNVKCCDSGNILLHKDKEFPDETISIKKDDIFGTAIQQKCPYCEDMRGMDRMILDFYEPPTVDYKTYTIFTLVSNNNPMVVICSKGHVFSLWDGVSER